MSEENNKRKVFLGRDYDDTIIKLEAEGFLAHTAIIGQSGSGKSFLLGRIIEELLINTNGKLVIFDLNADFIKISNVNNEIWQKEAQPKAYENLLVTDYIFDSKFNIFETEWKKVTDKIHIFGSIGDNRKIRISWKELNLNEWCLLLSIGKNNQPELVFLLNTLINYARDKWKFEHWKVLPKLIVRWARKRFGRHEEYEVQFEENIARYISYNFRIQTIQHFANALENALNYGILNEDSEFKKLINEESFRLLCINIASLYEKEARLFTIHHVLKQMWQYCIRKRWDAINSTGADDRRVPIFILIDEAHKVAPINAETFSEIATLELIKQIASEGRKFGLFLLIATQRPQKLHDDVLTEFDNVCIMHLVNLLDFKNIKQNFGFISDEEIKFEDLVEFKKGQGFFAGRWVKNGNTQIKGIAPQRTQPCGGDLKKENFKKEGYSKQLIKK